MAIQIINVGLAANDHTGDLLRNAFIKCNQNFAQLEADIAAISLTINISDVIGLQDALDALQADIDALNVQVNGDITAIYLALSQIDTDLTTINTAITNLQQEDISINNSITSINDSITNINNILNDLIVSAGVPEAPNDGQQYGRQNEGWTVIPPATPSTPSQLELVSEGLGPNTGWRLLGINTDNHGNIGSLAVDLSTSNTPSSTNGATGTSSFATGLNTAANGFGAFANGVLSRAVGDYSHASGVENTANSAGETVIGNFASAIAGNATSFVLTDAVFRVGIGTAAGSRNDGFRVYKNGALYINPKLVAAITNGANGFFFYNDATKKLASHDGTEWKDYAHIGTTAPASATAAGIPGEIRVTATFVYYCIAPNSWVRSAAAAW